MDHAIRIPRSALNPGQDARESELRVGILGPEDLDRWDDFVCDHPDGNVGHSAAWRRVLEEAFPHVSGRFLALEEARTRRIVAGLPIYSVKSWALGNRLICVPFAAWCDPLTATGQELAPLLKAARDAEEGAEGRFIEVRVRHNAELLKACGLVRSRRWLHHFVPLDQSREDLWRRLSRTAVRRLVRSAEKSGVEITQEDNPEALGLFHKMLSRTRRRLGLPQIPIRFFQAIQHNLKTDGQALLLARWRGLPSGGVLATKCKATCHLEYAGVASGQVPLGTMQLLYWKAMEMAHDEGCVEFSFGRTDPQQAGLIAYKRHWGCVEEELNEFRTRSKPLSDSQTPNGSHKSIARRLLRCLPNPLYELVSEIVYRHR